MKKKDRYVKLLVILLLVAVGLLGTSPAAAAPTESDTRTLSNGIFEANYTKLPDDSEAYYQIDLSETTKEEADQNMAENFIDSVQNFDPIGNTAEDKIMAVLNIAINLIFEWNMMMTNLMIGILSFSFETDIVNSWIDAMEGMVQSIAGVSGLGVNGGLFGSLLGLAVVATSLSAIYLMVVKRASIKSLQTIIQTVIALTLAFLLFANFAPFMKGANELSTQLSAMMLTGTTNVVAEDNRSANEIREAASANLWDSFIVRPYLIMQYNTDDVDRIGEERVRELLALAPGEERQEYIDEIEIGERGNSAMTYGNIVQRLSFSGIYSTINLFVSIPIYLLALALFIFQLWFVMMAFMSPFVMVVSAFPGQFRVLKRYAVELMYPLVCKVIVSAATLFIFALGFAIYSIPATPGIAQYFVSAFFQFCLFGLFFLLRKRIVRILSVGDRGPFEVLRNEINGLRQSVDQASSRIGSAGKAAVSITAGAATGGASTVVSSVLSSRKSNSEPAREEPTYYEKSDATEPIAWADEKESKPATEPVADVKTEKPAPAPVMEEEKTEEEDLTKPFASIDVRLKDEPAEKERNGKTGGGDDVR